MRYMHNHQNLPFFVVAVDKHISSEDLQRVQILMFGVFN